MRNKRMGNNNAGLLLEKYKSGTISEEELAMLESWYLQEVKSDKSYEGLAEQLKLMDNNVSALLRSETRRKNTYWKKIAAAACLLVTMAAGFWFYNSKSPEANAEIAGVTATKTDVEPGKKAATLTLSNGKKIKLSDALKGKLAEEAGIRITKTADGQILYDILGTSADQTGKSSGLNTLSTTNGESYSVRLPDGSLVVLNAASSLTYATNLNQLPIRSVALEGEAYFEIAKDKKRPFIVKTAMQEVAVLGTHFNINSYSNEPLIKTTLIEGRVKVMPENRTEGAVVLRPGEQASLGASTQLRVSTVDTEEVLAWKNGYFLFNDEEIGSILKKVARWYDVEIVYESAVSTERFNGMISRDKNLSQLIKMLERTDVIKFKIEGRRVIVK